MKISKQSCQGYSILIVVIVVCFCLLMLTYIFAMGLRINVLMLQKKYMRTKCINIAEGAVDYALYRLNQEGELPEEVKFEDGKAELTLTMEAADLYLLESISTVKENEKNYSETIWVKLSEEDGKYDILKIFYPSLSNYSGE